MAHASGPIDLDYRLRADRDLVAEHVDESVTQVRVTDDRGLVERVAADGGRFPLTLHVIQRQRLRFTTGPAQADGGFPATLTLLDRRTSLRLPSGDEVPTSRAPSLDNFKFQATVDPQGRLLTPTVQTPTPGAEGVDIAASVLATLLDQAARVETLRLEEGRPAQQEVNTTVQLPGLAALDLKITASNRLLDVSDGTARIELLYVLDFGVPEGPVRIEARGTGGGTMRYDVAAKVVRSMETRTLMTVLAHVPDGTLEFQMNTHQARTVSDAAP